MASSAPESFMLSQLPKELRDTIFSYLDVSDIHNLRATCSSLKELLPLRFDRVFLSANSRNIEVFRAIADHNTIRSEVREIIWDDARMWRETPAYDQFDIYMGNPERGAKDDVCPEWFEFACRHGEEDISEHVGSIGESWAYYQTLVQDEDAVLASQADVEAFKYGLQRFTSLFRVTITPATHGFPGKQLYRTPMIRAFPSGFQYPMPRGWPSTELQGGPVDAFGWTVANDDDPSCEEVDGPGYDAEAYRNKWRGFRVVTQALAEFNRNNISELVIEGHQVGSGINCHIFDQECAEYDNLVAILKRPGFRRLDLDLFTGVLEKKDWVSYRSGLLYNALAQAKDLESICLRSTMDIADGCPQQLPFWNYLIDTDCCVALRTIFPILSWPNLRHFGISQFLVDMDDLVFLLAALPPSIRSVELSHLAWAGQNHSYMELLIAMRDRLDWRSRPIDERPFVTMAVSSIVKRVERVVWVEKPIHQFLYEDGINPFRENENFDDMLPGRGGIERDMLDPSFERPF